MKLEDDKLPMVRVNRILSFLLKEMQEMTDEDRDHPIRWNIMHMYSSCQLAKILAVKRHLNPEFAGIIAAFHDMGGVYSGRKKNHAKKAEPYVRKIIHQYNADFGKDLNPITEEEEEIIISAVIDHSNKADESGSKYAELMKDVDSFDRLLHGIKTDGDHYKRAQKYGADIGITL